MRFCVGFEVLLGSATLVLAGCETPAAVPPAPREMAFVELPATQFEMGCTSGQSNCEEDELPFEVTLTHPYRLSDTEVTRAQFQEVMGYDPSVVEGCGADCPVDSVQWDEAAAFANALSEEESLQLCYACTGEDAGVVCEVAVPAPECSGYRLPTEAEWEAAARCGTDLQFAGSDSPNEVAWHGGNSGERTHPVARLAPNDCALFDMTGNVWEWTQDVYGPYPTEPATDPVGPSSGLGRANRGGSWSSAGTLLHVSSRHRGGDEAASPAFGFRVAAAAN